METKQPNWPDLLIKIGGGLIIIGGCLFFLIFVLSMCLSTSSTSTVEPPTTPRTMPTPVIIKPWDITNLNYKITDRNDIWWRFSWQCTLTNQTAKNMNFFITLNFLDKDGFIVDDDLENPPVFAPYEERIIRGYGLVDTSLAHKVYKIEAIVTSYAQ